MNIFDARPEWWYGFAQCVVYAVVIVAVALVVAKITDRGDTPTQGKGKRK